MTGRTVQIRCAHGDVTTYPLVNLHLEIDGVGVEVVAAASQSLPVSVLLGTDVPQLRRLLQTNPHSQKTDHHALVVTRAQAKRNAEGEDENRQKDEQSQVTPNPVMTLPNDQSLPQGEPPPFSELDNDLFDNLTPRKKLTRREKRISRHEFGLVRAKDKRQAHNTPTPQHIQ